MLPLGLACAAILAGVPGLDGPRCGDGRALAVRPLAVRPLLRDQQPARDDAARARRSSARRCSGAPESRVAALAFVTIGGNRFGADGGGIVVLAAAYLVLVAAPARRRRPTVRLARRRRRGRRRARAPAPRGRRCHRRRRATSPTRSATGRSPLAGDIADRIELSVRRTAASFGAARCRARLARDSRRASLSRPARRRARRLPRRRRGLARRQRHAGRRRSAWAPRSRSHLPGTRRCRRVKLSRRCAAPPRCSLCSPLIALPVGVAGCGGGEVVTPRPRPSIGTLPGGDDARRRRRPAALDARGRRGERREDLRLGRLRRLPHARGGRLVAATSARTSTTRSPTSHLAVDRVTNGPGAMPSFEGQLERAGDRRRRRSTSSTRPQG